MLRPPASVGRTRDALLGKRNGAGPVRRRPQDREPFVPYKPGPAEKAMRGFTGESPSFGRSTTTGAPTLTRLYRSITSSLVNRMQPDEIACPIYSGWLVPWTRNSVSLLPWYR